MSIIPNLKDIPEIGPVPAGEYDLRINSIKETTYDSGAKALMMFIDITDEKNTENVIHKLWLPTSLDDEAKTAGKWRRVKEFMEKLGMETDDETEYDEFVGITFTGELSLIPHFSESDREVNELVRIT